MNIENGKITNVRVIDNPAAAFKQDSGPIASKTLEDLRIDKVITVQIGPGASELLEYHKIKTIIIDPGKTVAESIREALLR